MVDPKIGRRVYRLLVYRDALRQDLPLDLLYYLAVTHNTFKSVFDVNYNND